MSYALITGAAKGIGAAVAVEMSGRGYDLLLVDMDKTGLEKIKEKITKLYGVTVHIFQIDLSLSDCDEKIKDWTSPFHNELNIVVNNAGYGLAGAFEKLPINEQLNIIDVNLKAQMKISHAFIPVLKKIKQSYLLNVGSVAGYQSVPYLSVYAATKAFLISFTRSLRYELKDSSISVSCLIPGSTDTDFVNRAGMGEHVRKTADRYNMTAEAVAKAAVNGLFNGKSEIIPGFRNKLHASFQKLFPKSFVEKIGGNIYKPREENTIQQAGMP